MSIMHSCIPFGNLFGRVFTDVAFTVSSISVSPGKSRSKYRVKALSCIFAIDRKTKLIAKFKIQGCEGGGGGGGGGFDPKAGN